MADASEKAVTRGWTDLSDEDDDGVLPPSVVIGPGEDGIMMTIEFRLDDAGNMVKVTTTTRVRHIAGAWLSKAAIERRAWSKFGDAACGDDDASALLTVVSQEEIHLQIPCTGTATGGNNTREVYIPQKREPVFYTPGRREKVAALCVTNLPEETDEFDMQLLFGRFGPIARLAVAVNPRTGRGRGFAFVNFVYKDHAEKAMLRVYKGMQELGGEKDQANLCLNC